MGAMIDSCVFQPPGRLYEKNRNYLSLRTRLGNEIPAVFVNKNAPVTIIFSHGNAEDMHMFRRWVSIHLANHLKFNALFYEYTGYTCGENESPPSEDSFYADIEAAYQYLTQFLAIDPGSIVLYGRSLGSGPSCYLAEKEPSIGGLIIQSGFLSILRVVLKFKFTFPGDKFPNTDRMERIEAPVLIIHGTKDEVIRFSDGVELFKKCKHPFEPLWVESAGHNDIEIFEPTMWMHVGAFLDHVRSGNSIMTAVDEDEE
eukprot:CAMPEP_0115010052 /NCGR_PEP_ID=MMETSP0216-20121206/23047_1 /TAXON_ID=223996 /ORGANISM="Protocruzia adherens, Strain Boccale" /LENGTH=256 /DNA_ID=CAMNT_0002378115 /DNA_START=91 /DNA_END=861 /DNA_ORIENTATION=+